MLKEMNYVELEYKKGKFRHFVHIDIKDDTIWIDTECLPPAAILCAMGDATAFLCAKCGPKRNIKRFFVKIDWAINEWGGDEALVEFIKQAKEKITSKIPDLKKKYQDAWQN